MILILHDRRQAGQLIPLMMNTCAKGLAHVFMKMNYFPKSTNSPVAEDW